MPQREETDFKTARARLEAAVYAAAASVLEGLEYAEIVGNAHHAAQKVAALAVEDLRRRWRDQTEVDDAAD